MVLIVLYIVASPFMAIYLVRTRRRWVRILRGQLDATRLAEQARAGRTEKAEPPAVA